MRIISRLFALPIVLCLMLSGCGGQQSGESPKSEGTQPVQASAPAPPATPAAEAAAKPGEAPKSVAAPPAPGAQAKAAPKDVAILKGAPFGPVKFEHKLHAQRAENRCETCHHPSRKEMPGKAAQESCLDCHTKPTMAGMKTGLPAAFHDAKAQAGSCIDCHLKENAQGKKAPTKCLDCHKKENT
jgi:hypothetical protein